MDKRKEELIALGGELYELGLKVEAARGRLRDLKKRGTDSRSVLMFQA